MDKYTATELAFKHGYEKGYEAGIAEEKKAYCDGLLDGRRAALECVPLAKWIPVTERLPEQYRSVIGWTKFREMGEVEHDGKQFVWTDEESVPAFVTHWMPLPEPPQEG